MAKNKRITVMDIARKAGVSHTSVSLALRGANGISPERAQAILRIAKEMNYRPRAAANLLRNERTDQLSILVASHDVQTAFTQGFVSPMLAAVVDHCARRQIRYVIEFHNHDEPADIPHQVSSGLVDGSLVIGDIGDDLRQKLDELGDYPWISIGEPAAHCVISANDVGFELAVDHLYSLGHRHIAFACGPLRYTGHRLAREGFWRGMKKHKLRLPDASWDTAHPAVHDAGATEEKINWARKLLGQPSRPTAMLCNSEAIARVLIHAAMEQQMRVPDDLSVICQAPVSLARQYYPALTTIAEDLIAVAQDSLEMLGKLVEDQPVDEPTRWIEPRLVFGQSVTAPCASR